MITITEPSTAYEEITLTALRSKVRRALCGLAFLSGSLLLAGCISTKSYVDSALPVVGINQITAAAHRRPVLVLFEFRTKGSANAAVTSQMRPRIIAVASESGLFSAVSGTATENTAGGQFKMVIDNIDLSGNAAAKGFGTGLTLGAVGSMVTDGYVATASFARDGKLTEVTIKHALHTTIGNKDGPAGIAAVTSQQGVEQVVDQLTWNALKQLAEKNAFD